MLDMTLNQIIAKFPEALPILTNFKLDTCCGGAHTLRDVIRKHKLDEQQVLAALEAVVSP
jgi:regulator of cell morphogenesis and NO signaling